MSPAAVSASAQIQSNRDGPKANNGRPAEIRQTLSIVLPQKEIAICAEFSESVFCRGSLAFRRGKRDPNVSRAFGGDIYTTAVVPTRAFASA